MTKPKEQKLICLRVVTRECAQSHGFEQAKAVSITYSLACYVSGDLTIEQINDLPHQITFKKYYEPRRHD